MNRHCTVLLLLMVALAGCSAVPPQDSRTLLDQNTGNTLLLVTHPLVFARERSDLAAYARDYATLVAVEVDVAGRYQDYFLLYRWSTVDKRMSPLPSVSSGELHLEADGRVIVLTALDHLPVSGMDLAALHYPRHADVMTYAYRVDAATLKFIAASTRIALRLPQEPFDSPFNLREDGRPSLAQFVRAEGVIQ